MESASVKSDVSRGIKMWFLYNFSMWSFFFKKRVYKSLSIQSKPLSAAVTSLRCLPQRSLEIIMTNVMLGQRKQTSGTAEINELNEATFLLENMTAHWLKALR